MIKYFVIRKFRGTCSSVEILKGTCLSVFHPQNRTETFVYSSIPYVCRFVAYVYIRIWLRKFRTNCENSVQKCVKGKFRIIQVISSNTFNVLVRESVRSVCSSCRPACGKDPFPYGTSLPCSFSFNHSPAQLGLHRQLRTNYKKESCSK